MLQTELPITPLVAHAVDDEFDAAVTVDIATTPDPPHSHLWQDRLELPRFSSLQVVEPGGVTPKGVHNEFLLAVTIEVGRFQFDVPATH